MKKMLLLPVLFVSTCFGQTPCLEFNGSTDYVDLGLAFNGARTIEFWFSPGENIDSSNPDFITLVSRETDIQNQNEISISFQKVGLPNPGTIRFNYSDNVSTIYDVYSDNNTWFQDRWYHVAAVIDPVDGMKLFINGDEQLATNPYNSAIPSVSYSTRLGRWGTLTSRDFKGKMEDVHISSEALYSSSFQTPCPNRVLEPSTIGLWHMNEGSGTVLTDYSSNSNDGTITNATWTTSLICDSIADVEENEPSPSLELSVSPNPTTNFVNVTWTGNDVVNTVALVNSSGQLVQTLSSPENNLKLNVENLNSGIYFIHVVTDSNSIVRKLIKN